MLHIYEDNEASGGYGIGVKSKDTWVSVASSYGGLLPDMSYGELIMGNEGISSQEAAYGSTSIALSISGKAELFRLLEGSKTMPKYFKAAGRLGPKTRSSWFSNYNVEWIYKSKWMARSSHS